MKKGLNRTKGEWGINCNDFSIERLIKSVDFFCFAHLFGWAFKTLLVRHYGILWTISIMWEITEVCFSHLLPNFIECWWDSLILDILLCNGLGIWLGMQVCYWMEMRYYNWESIKDIQSTTGKLKRAALQFTPESWTAMRWLDPACTYMRFLAVCQVVVFWQVSELNTFFIKHIFEMPPNHPLVAIRIFILGAMSAPSLRQYYSYVTDPRCKRVGTQCWVYGVCMCIESCICIKFGAAVFKNIQIQNILLWILIQMVGAVICVYLCVIYHRWSRRHKYKKEDSFDECDSESKSSFSSPSANNFSRKTVTLSTPESDGNLDTDSDNVTEYRRRKHPAEKVYRKRRAIPKSST